MADIFISHVQEDGEIATALAEGLEAVGYSTWYYERDNRPITPYLLQVKQAIEDAQVVLLVISRDSLGSHEVTTEIRTAYRLGSVFCPVLVDISYAEFGQRQPEWDVAIATASAVELSAENPGDTVFRIIEGLRDAGVEPSGERAAEEPQPEPSAATAPAPEATDFEAELEERPPPAAEADHAREPAWRADVRAGVWKRPAALLRRWWVVAAGVAVVLIGAGLYLHLREAEQAGTAAQRPAEQARPEAGTEGEAVSSAEGDRPCDRPGTKVGQEIEGPAGIPLVWVPAGKFMMGSNDGDGNEKPVHEVELDGFWIGKTEVTVAQWRALMGSVPRHNEQGDDHPVVVLSWNDCQEFCSKLGLSLPTEAQWEYAARGPESRVYPWGDEWDEEKCCNYDNRGPEGRTFPVGSFPAGASWCGALDLVGNVWERCADWYDEDHYQNAARRNPTGPGSGTFRVLRGGSWVSSALYCRSAARLYRYPEFTSDGGGFRVARSCR